MKHTIIVAILLAAAPGQEAAALSQVGAPQPVHAAAAQTRMLDLPITIMHAEVVKLPPDRMWSEIKRMYVEGQKFSPQGYRVDRLEDAVSWLGGTRISRKLPDGRLEERVARVSALDEARRFLALSVQYSEGFVVRASYEVRPHPAGSEFQLIAHVDQPFELASDDAAGRKRMADAARAVALEQTKGMADAWAAERIRLEKGQ